MAISLHNSSVGVFQPGSGTIFVTLSASVGEIVIAQINSENPSGSAPVVSGISDGTANVWHKHFSTTQVPESNLGSSESFEVWWTYAANALVAANIIVTSNVTDDTVLICAGYQGFTGTYYQTNPWDKNVSLPASAFGYTPTLTSTPSVPGVSTSTASGMLLFGVGSCDFTNTMSAPTGFALVKQAIQSGGTNAQQGNLFNLAYSSAQSSVTITGTGSALAGWIAWADALTDQQGATTFLEPGGDATFLAATITAGGFWSSCSGTLATDFVHGGHLKSYKVAPSTSQRILKNSIVQDSGVRTSFYFYMNALPTATATVMQTETISTPVQRIRVTSGGVLQLWTSTVQIGTNGATLSAGTWYRVCLAYTITSSSVNRFELFVDAVSSISVTNSTGIGTGASDLVWTNANTDTTLDFRISDVYIDNSSSLTDTGNIWVTAKRPNANGTTNGFTTQIGAGGSGYGTGHAQQVNERPLSNTNGWSMIGAGSAITEEYNVENVSTGDMNITGKTIVDYIGWVDTKSLIAETAQIIVNNVTSNIAVTTAETIFTKVAGSATYLAGTGTDIGIVTSTTVTTVSLYECGIMVAFIGPPVTNTTTTVSSLSILGAG